MKMIKMVSLTHGTLFDCIHLNANRIGHLHRNLVTLFDISYPRSLFLEE